MINFWCWTPDSDREEDGKHIVARDSQDAAEKAAQCRRLGSTDHFEHWNVRAEGATAVQSFTVDCFSGCRRTANPVRPESCTPTTTREAVTVEERISPHYYASESGAAETPAPVYCSCGLLEEMHSNPDGSCRWFQCGCEKFDPIVGFPMKRR